MRTIKNKQHPIYFKLDHFKTNGNPRKGSTNKVSDFRKRDNRIHKFTVQGGKSTLDNLGLTTKHANIAKNGYTPEEFIQLCKDVLLNFGYQITKAAR